MLFAARELSDVLAGLPELVVEGLRGADARSLLASVIPGRFDERVADELLTETRGNPLALLELPRGLSAAQLAGGFALPGALSLSGRIEESFRLRLEALPDETQQLLLVAAAEPVGDPALLWRAVERFGVTSAALAPAESAGLLEVDARVRFRHPLVRSAIYRAATPRQRQEVHRALAEATDVQVDPDRRAWHLAEAASGPDEDTATDSSARRVVRRHVGDWRPRRRSWSGRPRSHPTPHCARSARWRPRRPSLRLGRSTTLSLSWLWRRQAPSTTDGAPGWICCELKSRSRPGAGATRPRSC